MRIDVWTDIICPFCTIAKAELDKALESFPHADAVTVVPRSYELHPGAPVEPTTEYLEKKYGWSPAVLARQCDHIDARARGLGLTYNWRPSINAPTLDAHRLVKLETHPLTPLVDLGVGVGFVAPACGPAGCALD